MSLQKIKPSKISDSIKNLRKEDQLLILSWLYQKTPHTRRAYQRIVSEFFVFYKSIMLHEIETAHLLFFLDTKKALKPSARNQIKSCFNSLYEYGAKTGKLNCVNPTLGLSFEKIPSRVEEKVLTRSQIAKLIRASKNPRDRLMILFLYKTGMRISEALNLRRSDFKPQYGEDKSCHILVLGKGQKLRRIRIKYLLWKRLRALFVFKDDSEFLFKTRNKPSRLTERQVNKILLSLSQAARLNVQPSAHWFRHTNATDALNRGAPIHVVQKTLGHSSLSTTSLYTEIRPKQSSGDWL